MSTTSRYLFPPMLKTVRRAPRKLAVGKSARSSCGDRYFRPFRIRYHASSGTFASACLSPNSRRAFLEMIRNAPPQPDYSHTGNAHSQYGNIGSFGQSLHEGVLHITFRASEPALTFVSNTCFLRSITSAHRLTQLVAGWVGGRRRRPKPEAHLLAAVPVRPPDLSLPPPRRRP